MLIKACLNGGTTRLQHPAVPLTPDELAADARDAVRAGAGAIHVHPRDSSGDETLEADAVLAAVRAIRAAVPQAPVGVTTGIWAVGGDPARRLALVSGWTGDDQPDFASVNLSEPRVHHGYGTATWHVLRAAVRRGRGIRIGLEDTTVLEDGSFVTGNADLVAAAVRLAADEGHQP
jgi:uncharacterized protein (DUF849 family)